MDEDSQSMLGFGQPARVVASSRADVTAAVRVTQLASAVAFICALGWFTRDGFSWAAGSALVFSWHPVLMTTAFVVLYPNSALLFAHYLPGPDNKATSKPLHAALHLVACLLAVVALVAVFRFHGEATPPIPDMYSLHSIVGMLAIVLYMSQFVVGFLAFFKPQFAPTVRARLVTLHAAVGSPVLAMLLGATVVSGVLEKLTFIKACNPAPKDSRCYWGNALGLTSLVCFASLAFVLTRRASGARR